MRNRKIGLLATIAITVVLMVASYEAGADRFQLPDFNSPSATPNAPDCRSFRVSKGDGEGILRHCVNGDDQTLYLSGDLDTKRDLNSVKSVIGRMKKATQGRFTVITKDAGGGDVDWHSKLMMAVEDHCVGKCRIQTEVHGQCESACNQLHLTCARGARTLIMANGKLCEHASMDGPGCHRRDPKPPYGNTICDREEAVAEYTRRCNELMQGRASVDVDPKRQSMIKEYASKLAEKGVFDSESWTCHLPPWAEPAGRPLIQHAMDATK